MQNWFGYSDPTKAEALYETYYSAPVCWAEPGTHSRNEANRPALAATGERFERIVNVYSTQ